MLVWNHLKRPWFRYRESITAGLVTIYDIEIHVVVEPRKTHQIEMILKSIVKVPEVGNIATDQIPWV